MHAHKRGLYLKSMKTYILLENVRLYAFHGVGIQENIVGNQFVINLKAEIDLTNAINSDSLIDTISYADIYQVLKDEMDIPSKLLEHVGGRIMSALRAKYPSILHVELKITKCTPPMGADLDGASILLID